MKHSRLIFRFCLAACLLSASGANADSIGWEQVKTEVKDAKQIAKDSDIEIRTTPTFIIVTSSRPLQIKVFTILGRLVSEQSLPAGTSRLDVGAHGVYIVKAGDFTCKVAI